MKLLAELGRDLKAASARVAVLRPSIHERREALVEGGEDDLAWTALQEVEIAHEELRVAEEELHSQADEIAEARASLTRDRRVYTELFDAAPDAYLVTGTGGVILQANRRAAALIGVEPARLAGKPLATLIVQEDRARFFDLLESAGDAVFRANLRIQPRNARHAIRVALSAQRGAFDKSIRWILRGIGHDDEPRAIEHAVAKSLRDRNRDRALVEAAHEVRTMLATMAGWLKMLSDNNQDEETNVRAVASLTRSASGMNRIADDLAELPQTEGACLELKLSTLNLVQLVIEVVEDLRPLAQLKQIRIAFSASSYTLEMEGDTWRLQQLFKHLVGNAIQFTPEGGTIHVSITQGELRAEVAITDTGRGLPSESLAKLFASTLDDAEPGIRPTKLELGLGIARRVAELHHGTIRAESDGAGCGSTFTVRLPLFASN